MKKMKMINKDPISKMLMNSLVNLPTPTSISFLWNMGFLLGMTLTLQVATGLVLSMNYIASTEEAFSSVIHIMRDLESGWMMRFLHMNGASLFFSLMYIHMARGLYFESPKKVPMVWLSGLVVFLMSMAAAFMGYVLPWGQMSFWGATVITSMLSAIPYMGKEMTLWLWGNFSVSQPTLNRFLSLHFLIPLLVVALVMVHLMLLHQTGSSSPLGLETNKDKMKFFPMFMVKDLNPMLGLMLLILTLISVNPNMLGDVENYMVASPEVTPTHIQPEWYFLFAYAILRAIPSKLGGVLAMLMSIIILAVPTFKKPGMNSKMDMKKKMNMMMFMAVFLVLTWIGANPVEEPFILVGQISTMIYFTLALTL